MSHKTISVKKTAIRILSVIFLFLYFSQHAASQTISATDRKKLGEKEDSLKVLAKNLNTDSTVADRMITDSMFVKTLIRSLQIKNSFYHPFDSVLGISKLYSPDTAFRIFTWGLSLDEDGYRYRQRGAIQFRTPDGSLKLTPLIDCSEFTANAADSVRTKNNWIGAVYYNIIKTQFKGKNYYTLFGFDHNSAMSSKKWIEVLSFNEKNEPIFGGQFFLFNEDSIPKSAQHRFHIEYKKQARTLVNYVPDLQMILVDHLISEDDQPENKWTLVPDGDYEGFKWVNGKWVHVDKVFTFKLKDGEAPVGDPLLDSKGNRDEKKLQEKSDKNKKGNERIPINYDN